MVKGTNGSALEFVEVDPSILGARKTLGFDHGKFDYLTHNGQAVLIDINATPTFGRSYSPDVRERIASTLAPGIAQWFPDVAR